MLRFSDIAELADKLTTDLAECMLGAIEKRGHGTLALSGGRTPHHIFPALADKTLPWHRVTVTLADERWVEPSDPDSNEGLARRLLLQGAASAAQFIGLKSDHENPREGHQHVETALDALAWPLDGLFLGMGEDGHIASLFPGAADWMTAPGRAWPVPAQENRQARMSLTPAALLDSRHIFLALTGPEKRATLDAALKPGDVGEYPVRLILHQDRAPVTIYALD